MKVVSKTFAPLLFLAILLIFAPMRALALQDDPPQVTIELGPITPPTECSTTYWTAYYERKVTMSGTWDMMSRPRYFVQYVNDDVNLVHYWESGYDAYVQDYMLNAGRDSLARVVGSYAVPLWSDTYHAVSIEYIVEADQVLWEVRAELECEDGTVTHFQMTSQAASGTRESLPQPGENLVLALEDIPRYSNPYNQTGDLGMIYICQTFYISRVYMPRASISTWAYDSITKQPIQLFDGSHSLPIVDVAENYGQPGGQPILDPCSGA